ncbi:MAG: Cytochrome c-type biogenesis protein CcmF [Turneriella sp.]|nr:Cytochrome c-type biogenesis protein CcmF [Turneriella sp.]
MLATAGYAVLTALLYIIQVRRVRLAAGQTPADALYATKALRTSLSSARSAVELHLIAVSICVALLLYMLATADFSIVYVAEHVNLQLPMFYRLTSLWAGQAGSMLWWNFLVILFSYLAIRHIRKVEPVLEPYMIAILMAISLFFTAIGCFAPSSDPFRIFQAGIDVYAQPEGRGLNPLLQHWAMIIHPPILYLGYVAFAVPFAIAMSALLYSRNSKNTAEAVGLQSLAVSQRWIKYVRRWTIFSWFFLGAGILLGGKWAYEELGWGGYWAWDPVENASLMPWLTATAFLHSIIVEEKRGMLKVWNMVLVSITFIMTVVGTALTRSGVVQSVHAFAQSNLGGFFLAFIILIILFCAWLIYRRYDLLKSATPIESLLSREVGFLFNNVLLLASLFIVFFGTMYPTISEAISGRRESVTAEWFNRFMAPMGIIILFLTGLGPLLAWRVTKLKVLFKNLRLPLAMAFVAALAAFFIAGGFVLHWNTTRILALFTFAGSAFVITGVLEEWYKASRARRDYTRENFFIAHLLVLFQNKRRFLGYMVHIAMAILFSGFAGLSFGTEGRLTLAQGETQEFSGYQIHIEKYEEKMMPEGARVPLYGTRMVTIAVYKDNKLLGRDTTEIRTYPMFSFRDAAFSDSQNTSEPAIISTLFRDVYVQLGGDEKGRLVMQVWINPLVRWVWAGFGFYIIMGLLLLLPIGEKKVLRLGRFTLSVTPQPKTA